MFSSTFSHPGSVEHHNGGQIVTINDDKTAGVAMPDQRERSQRRYRNVIQSGIEAIPTSPFLPIAEDIDWLRNDWLDTASPPSNATLRRGSATLRRLLCDGVIHQAWRHHGLGGTPTAIAPDLAALAAHQGMELRHAVSLVAGGATIDHVHICMVGAWRVDNPTTGIAADADEGFAVSVGSIMRDTRGAEDKNELTPLVEREWRLGQYLNAPGAVRRGQKISRRQIIEFFANYAGGVHLDRAAAKANAEKLALYELVAELEGRIICDKTEGLFYELLSIGQALGGSPTLQRLVSAVYANISQA